MRGFILFCLFAALAPAQVVSVGIKGGVPLTDAVRTYGGDYTSMLDTGRWTVGPTIEFKLVKGLSVEADALYRGYRQLFAFVSEETIVSGAGMTSITYPAMFVSDSSKTKVWDFPLLLKYRFGSRSYRPFVDAGVTFSHGSTDTVVTGVCLSSADVCSANPYLLGNAGFVADTSRRTDRGPTAGAGVEFKIGKFMLSPELRYTRLSNPTRSLATLLVGFTY